MEALIGRWAFIIGVLVAVVAGFWQDMQYVALILLILGLVVGFLNVSAKESRDFILAAIGLIVVSAGAAGLKGIPSLGVYLVAIFTNIAAFVAPALLIVALKSVYGLAKEK